MFSFSAFLLFGKTLQTLGRPLLPPRRSHPAGHRRGGVRLSRVPEFSVDLLSGPRPKPLLLYIHRTEVYSIIYNTRHNGHLYPDGIL